MPPFEFTAEGYKQAKAWCEENKIDIESLLQKEQSTDGYTMIALVNQLGQLEG